MSDDIPTYYQAPGSLRPETLCRYDDPRYQPPTPEDLRLLVQRSGKTGDQIAAMVGVAGRTVRKWQSPINTSNHTAIPYSAWRLLLIETGRL